MPFSKLRIPSVSGLKSTFIIVQYILSLFNIFYHCSIYFNRVLLHWAHGGQLQCDLPPSEGVCLQLVQVLLELLQQVCVQLCQHWSRWLPCQATTAKHLSRLLVREYFPKLYLHQNVIHTQGNKGYSWRMDGPGRWGGGWGGRRG